MGNFVRGVCKSAVVQMGSTTKTRPAGHGSQTIPRPICAFCSQNQQKQPLVVQAVMHEACGARKWATEQRPDPLGQPRNRKLRFGKQSFKQARSTQPSCPQAQTISHNLICYGHRPCQIICNLKTSRSVWLFRMPSRRTHGIAVGLFKLYPIG